MKRLISAAVLTSLVTLSGVVAVGPGPLRAVAEAQVTDQQLMEQLKKAKQMVADIEMKLMSKKMPMDRMGMEKTMKMLMDVNKMLEDLGRQSP